MNIHEAEEIVRNKSVIAKDPSQWAGYLRAREVLIETMLSELDPTPISEDWLRENGWVFSGQPGYGSWVIGDSFLRFDDDYKSWLFEHYVAESPNVHVSIKTLGELRTLLRLMGGTT